MLVAKMLFSVRGYWLRWLRWLQRLRWLQPEPPEKTGASPPEGLGQVLEIGRSTCGTIPTSTPSRRLIPDSETPDSP